MTTSRKLVRSVHAVAEKLRVAGVWNTSRQAVDAGKDHYVYELLCYFHIAAAAKTAFTLQLGGKLESPRNGSPVARWPKKPAKKTNFSFILLRDRQTQEQLFQLCPGIEVMGKHEKTRAPDTNLLSGDAPDDPTYERLHACWDAKYSQRPGSPVPDVAISDFVYTFQQLGAPAPPPHWRTAIGGTPFVRSGVVTNAGKSSGPDGALTESGISETCNFPDSPNTRP